MTVYTTRGPNEAGEYIVGYPTPGAPHIFTAAGAARTQQAAEAECARLNEPAIAAYRAELARKASLIIIDGER